MKCNVSTCNGERVPGDVLCERCIKLRDAWTEAATALVREKAALSFRELAEKNRERCESAVFNHRINDWSPTDWGCALAGEVGEACNLIKKLRRGDEVTAARIAEEVADVVIYADLLCQRLGVRLEDAVREKFNAKSVEKGSPVRLGGVA